MLKLHQSFINVKYLSDYVLFDPVYLPNGYSNKFVKKSQLCMKHEWPLIMTYSLYSEKNMHYHFY